jgi:hypothetical protein
MKQQKQVSKQEVTTINGYKSGDITKLAILLLIMMIIFILGLGIGAGLVKKHDRKMHFYDITENNIEEDDSHTKSTQVAEEVQIELPPVEAKEPAMDPVDSQSITQ